MAWKTLNRNEPAFDKDAPAVLREAVREKIRSLFGRYETKRAALLPALHIVQDELGHVSYQAMAEIAELLEIHPSDVIDTISFYTHFWTHPKGKKAITVCRSISCELLGGVAVLAAIKERLGIDEHQTTPDGRYSLVTEECLAGCDHAPCMIINEKMHKRVKVEDVARILEDPDNAKIEMPRSTQFDAPPADSAPSGAGAESASVRVDDRDDGEAVGSTSNVEEMRDAE
jgi:NADH-quinone oxidoreductase subunit E